jgi:diguanylate cyclase (GGDEF)-like protein
MVDLDHFKLVNDNYGHAVGDVVIKLLVEVLQSSCRQDYLVARYGGEEFCVVLPNQTIEIARKVAELIRMSMEDESIKRFETDPHVTVSIGVASIFDNPENPDRLNNMADESLCIAKSSGRNQVVIWSSQSSDSPPDNTDPA